MLGYIGSVYRYLPSHVKNGIVILLWTGRSHHFLCINSTFLGCKYVLLKDTTRRPEWGSNSRPLDPESEVLTTRPPRPHIIMLLESIILFILNSCSLIGRGHVKCEPVDIDIVLEQLILCSSKSVSSDSGQSLHECHKLCCCKA